MADLPTSELKTPGRKPMEFHKLKERTKKTYSRTLALKHSMEELLRAAEAIAYKNGNSATRKVLKLLRNGSEAWAKETLGKVVAREPPSKPSTEKSLMLKTRLSLSKTKYRGIASFMRQELRQKLVPWKDVMTFRNEIIPRFAEPNQSKSYLSVSVTVRDMVTKDVERVMELDVVRSKLDSIASEGVVDCLMYVSAGPDSATGFSHYNQAKFLARDDSLLTEHFMSLKLESNGRALYCNPNPQSDTFCRVRSMCWTKETDVITRKMFEEFFREVDVINENPIAVQVGGVTLRVKVEGIYSMVDGKAANAIVGNRDTHACPMCVKGADPRIGPSYFHSRLNAVEWIMRNAAKKAVPGNPAQSHPAVKAEARRQADQLEKHFNLNINRPKVGGSGSSNTGNMARRLLDQPEKFSEVLNISVELVKNLRLISSLALSSRRLKAKKLEELYKCMEKQILDEFPFVKRLPPCIHKYTHLPELVQSLPYTMNFVDEQAGERCHKRHKFSRPHLSRKTSAVDNLTDMMRAALAWSDPKMSYIDYKTTSKHPRKLDNEFEAQIAEYIDSEEDEPQSNSSDFDEYSNDSDGSDSDEDDRDGSENGSEDGEC